MLGGDLRHEIVHFLLVPRLPGDGAGIGAVGMLVVEHRNQKVGDAGEGGEVVGVAVQLHVLRHQQAQGVECGGEFGHERCHRVLVGLAVRLEVDVDALIAPRLDVMEKAGDSGMASGGVAQHRVQVVEIEIVAVLVVVLHRRQDGDAVLPGGTQGDVVVGVAVRFVVP